VPHRINDYLGVDTEPESRIRPACSSCQPDGTTIEQSNLPHSEAMQPATANYLRGALPGLAAVSIWAGWSAMTRLAVTTSLDAWDIPALRFGIAGILLSPILMRRGIALDRAGWLGLGGLIFGTGAPYALMVAIGLRFAPAYDAGALNPGCIPLFVALIAAIVLREKPFKTQKRGLSLILFGALITTRYGASCAASVMRCSSSRLF
jgi:drug/metabolite transporter (DMT)-like permease